jgi:hypothetical protein
MTSMRDNYEHDGPREEWPAVRPPQELLTDVAGLERTVSEIIREARRPTAESSRVACDACEVVARRAAFWQPLAEDQDRRMTVEVIPGPVPVGTSGDDLAACTDILLENVFAHTPGRSGVLGPGQSPGRWRRVAGGLRRRSGVR